MPQEKKQNRKSGSSSHKKRRQQQVRRQLILIATIAVVVIAITGTIIVKTVSGKKTESEASSKKVTAVNLDEADTTEGTKENEEETKPEEVTDDRAGYAVSPGVSVGSDTETEEKVVYLTFDDGPSSNTQAVLDILDRYNAKATFFVTNINPDYANMIKVAYDKGHTIGLHTYSHDYGAVYASVDAYFSDLDAIGQLVQQQIGYVPCFIRFPGGSSNTVSAEYSSGIMSTLVQEVQNRGYQYYDWNSSSGDGAVRSTAELIDQGTAWDGNNLVFLSHDANSKESTVDALPTIIEHYQSMGYAFKALDRSSYDAHHGVNN